MILWECWGRRALSIPKADPPFFFSLSCREFLGRPEPKATRSVPHSRENREFWDGNGTNPCLRLAPHPIPPSHGCWSTLQRENSRKSMELSLLTHPGISIPAKPIRNCMAAPLEFSAFQGEVGVGAAGPRGPRGFPGPRVGPSENIPGLDSCSLHPPLEAAPSIHPSHPSQKFPGRFQAAKFLLFLRSFGLFPKMESESRAVFKFVAVPQKNWDFMAQSIGKNSPPALGMRPLRPNIP